MATVTWKGGNGAWNGTNWSSGATPGNTDIASDSLAGTILIPSGSVDTVGGITLNNASAKIDVNGGLLYIGTVGGGGFTGSITNTAGTLLVEGGGAIEVGNVVTSASGSVTIDGFGSTYLWGGSNSTQTVIFASSAVDSSFVFQTTFNGTVQGFGAGDSISYSTVNTITNVVISQNKVAFFDSAGEHDIKFSGNYNASNLTVSGNSISTTVPCYVAGTRIATPEGDRPVEAIRAGDLVQTLEGGPRVVRWVGHRHVAAPTGAQRPLRVLAGCFGPGLPARDLYLSAEHALFIDGCLVPARALDDGHAITAVDVDAVSYHHIELDTHDILLAEGLACESYFDNDDDARFQNAAARVPSDMTLYAPLHTQGATVERIRRRLRAMSVPA